MLILEKVIRIEPSLILQKSRVHPTEIDSFE